MVAPHFHSTQASSALARSTLDDAKRAARLRALTVRQHHDPAVCGAALADHVLRVCPPPPGAIVAGFLPVGEEIDLRPLLLELHARGHVLVLPVTPPRGHPLGFRTWTPGDPLVTERFGTTRPTGPERVPDFLLVPLLAFDVHGRRLGYGAGYYDRTLAALPQRFALGCAYAAQQIEAVPAGPHDVALDAVATERGVIRCERP